MCERVDCDEAGTNILYTTLVAVRIWNSDPNFTSTQKLTKFKFFFSHFFFFNLHTGTQQFGSGSTVCIGLRLDLGQPTAISATTGPQSRPTHPRMSVTILPVLSDLDLEGGEVVLEVNSGGPVGPGLMRNRSGQLL